MGRHLNMKYPRYSRHRYFIENTDTFVNGFTDGYFRINKDGGDVEYIRNRCVIVTSWTINGCEYNVKSRLWREIDESELVLIK